MPGNRHARIALFAAVVVAVQVATHLAGKAFFLTQLTMAAYYTLVAAGLSVLMGYAGQISLGHAAFFAIGGYASGYLTTAPRWTPSSGCTSWWSARTCTAA